MILWFPQSKLPTNYRILGLDSILNIVINKQGEGRDLETSDDLIRHMEEYFKAKAIKFDYVYYAAIDAVILQSHGGGVFGASSWSKWQWSYYLAMSWRFSLCSSCHICHVYADAPRFDELLVTCPLFDKLLHGDIL